MSEKQATFFQALSRLFSRRSHLTTKPTHCTRPNLEFLEDRWLLANTYLWIGSDGLKVDHGWANMDNWTNTANGTRPKAILNGDSLIFDVNKTILGKTGTSTVSNDNITALQLDQLTIGQFQGVATSININLACTLTVKGTIQIGSGGINGKGSFIVPFGTSQITWWGGTLGAATMTIGAAPQKGVNIANSNPTLIIDYPPRANSPTFFAQTPRVLATTLTSWANVTVAAPFELDSIFNNNGACTISQAGSITLNKNGKGTFPTFNNNTTGTVTANIGNGQEEIDANFTQNNVLTLQSGTLLIAGSFVQSAKSSVTSLVGGNLYLFQNYQLQNGQLSGSGTISGTVVQTGGNIIPGNTLKQAPLGQLVITGDYSQGKGGNGGNLTINILNATSNGLLVVQDMVSSITNLSVVLLQNFQPVANTIFPFLSSPNNAIVQNLPATVLFNTYDANRKLVSKILFNVNTGNKNRFTLVSQAPQKVGAGPAGTTTTVVSNTSMPTVGGNATFSATVSSSGAAATGYVTFFDGNYFIGQATLSSSSVAILTTPALILGSNDIVAIYSGDTNDASSTSSDIFVTATEPATPILTGISASTGTTAGGISVTLTGSFLSGVQAVYFGTTSAAFAINNDNQITAIAPSQSAATEAITVVSNGGSSATSSADLFTYTSASAPVVSGLSQTSGSTAGNTVVTISGSGFTGATSVSFGTTTLTTSQFTVLADGSIVATAPAETAGSIYVTVTTPAGTSATSSSSQYTFVAPSAPTVSALDVISGTTTGDTLVTLTGTGFLGATSVQFGSDVATSFVINSATSISAYTPAQSAGTFHTTVTTAAGTSATSSADQFSYSSASLPAISSLSSSSGSTAGGTLLTLTGSGFTNAYTVTIGTTSLTNFTINSDSQISIITPPNAAGTWDVTVTTPSGTSIPTATSQFTYSLASVPTVISLGTTSGSTVGGTSVTLTGSNFTSATTVLFGTTAASFVVNSATSITAVSPSLPAGIVNVTVTTGGGTSASSSSNQFTFTAGTPPAVTALATSGGSTGGGTAVTISGSGFLSATSVNFGSVGATFSVLSDNLISAVSPAQAAATVDVTVTSSSGTSTTSSADHFSYSAASSPSISGLYASTGPTTGATSVTILGSYFTGATSVTFGGVAVSFVVNSDTSLTASSPLLPAGVVNVQITTPSGTSSIVAADQFTFTNVTASAPAVTAVSPNTGSTAGGQAILITGTNFSGTTAVKFGSTSATGVSILSDSLLSVVAPVGTAGTVDITVTTNNGTSATSSADHYSYQSAAVPAVTGVSPSSTTTAGGASITITGTNFTSASAVLFSSTAATSFTVNSSTQITAVVPALAVGTYDILNLSPPRLFAVTHQAQSNALVVPATMLATLPLSRHS